MEYRQLGQTPLQVSIVGFGASPLGNVFGEVAPAEANAAIDFAIENGINFFDVSPYYGRTLAEERLGQGLRGKRHNVLLATKCGRYGVDEFDFSRAAITRGLEASLKRLKTDHVDLLQAHDVEFTSADQIVDETLPAMRELQRQGKARHIGITGYSLANLVSIAARAPVDTVLSYCRYNLLVNDMADVLVPFAKPRRIGIINASALHMGVLTGAAPPAWHPAPAHVREAGAKVVELCKRHGTDASELALSYSFANQDISTTLVGMSTRKDVQGSLNALKSNADPELMREVFDVVAPVHNYTWPSGLAANHG